MKPHPILFALSAALALAGCGNNAPSPESTSSAAPAPDGAQARPAAPAAPTSASPAAPAQGAGGFGPRPSTAGVGVTECDSFLLRYERCMRRVPAEQRGGMQTALDSWRGTWRGMAAMPGSQDTLAQTCSTARDEARQQFLRYGCEL